MTEEERHALSAEPGRSRWWKRTLVFALSFLVTYLIAVYLMIPALWKRYTEHHPSYDVPNITETASGIPGDPLNVSLIGTEAELKRIMQAAKWYPAQPLGVRSDLRIAEDTVLDRPYDDAPVSSLYLFGRKEDLAFEQPVGNDPRQRHHVRLWLTQKIDADGRPVWIGSAVYDDRVGFSRRTGQITHHTAPDVDAERDKLFEDLHETGELSEMFVVDGFHKALSGRNGGGDPWYTDGKLYVGVIATALDASQVPLR